MDEKTQTTASQQNDVDMSEKLAQLQKALNEERSLRKKAEKLLQDNSADEEEIKQAEASIRAKLKNGKSELSDDVVDDLMNTFGKAQARNQVKASKSELEREIMELKRDSTYMDIEDYGKDIRDLVKKSGLSVEQAYWAIAGANKFSNIATQSKADADKKERQESNKARAKEGYVDNVPGAEETKPSYTEKEKFISAFTNMSLEEVKARSNSFSIDDILANNQKFKK